MQKISLPVLVLLAMTLSGCELAGDIFQAGFTTAIVLVVVVVLVIVWLVSKARR
jgi:hypothetical protein